MIGSKDIQSIIVCIDQYLEKENLSEVSPPDVSGYLDQMGVLTDSDTRRGKPLRELLRAKKIPHAYQIGNRWVISHSNRKGSASSSVIKKSTPLAAKIISSKRSKHKLEVIAESIKAKLSAHFGANVAYTLEYKPTWLQGFPNEVRDSKYWLNICKAYAELNDHKLDLNTRLESYSKQSRAQSFDIWFHEPANFAVEFDESQHFNQFRKSTFKFYNGVSLKFDINQYEELCTRIVRPGTSNFQKTKNNDWLFPYQGNNEAQDNRIRQRAFRDMLKDVYPLVIGYNSTFRIPYHLVNNKIKDFDKNDLNIVDQIIDKALTQRINN